MKILKLLMICFAFLLLINNINAFMPKYTHKLMFSEGIAKPVNTEEYRACVRYPSLCYTGNVLVDVSVIFYYTQFGLYRATHDPNFARMLREDARNDKELACASGGGIHQAQDLPSHTQLVPYAIKHSGLVNEIIHVFAEQKVDNWVERNHKKIGTEALAYIDDYKECIPLLKRVMLRDISYIEAGFTEQELDEKFDKFIQEIKTSQTGYDTSFKSKGVFANIKAVPVSILFIYITFMLYFMLVSLLLILKIVFRKAKIRHYLSIFIFLPIFIILLVLFVANATGYAFQTFIYIIKPISELVPLGAPAEFYVDKGIQNTQQFFIQGQRFLDGTESSGYTALKEANRVVQVFDFFLFIILIIILILWSWFLFKKERKIVESFIYKTPRKEN